VLYLNVVPLPLGGKPIVVQLNNNNNNNDNNWNKGRLDTVLNLKQQT
jgi:hypothetical protein